MLPPAPRKAVQKKQMPFLAVAPRLAVRAVKGAPFAFTGAKRKPLTEEAHGLGAGFCQEGQGREDREENDDRAKQQKRRPRLCAGAESDLQSERSLGGLGRWLAGRSWQFVLLAIELAHDIGADGPRCNLHSLRLLAFAVRLLIGRWFPGDRVPAKRRVQAGFAQSAQPGI